ncbi:unnamed protein product [Mytilus edulis]|uniref:Uncharacterized protein n=1 Tax=Mytilus edulis TaxID=6550 RepID=A0A8S3Q1P6_MYTED|nr:unnamed protein product [Mytilus edulis]
MELTNNSLSKSEKDLELAIKSNDLTLLQEVIQRGANINARNYVGSTALHMAVSGNASVDILRTLMENGATVAVKITLVYHQDRDNNSLMHIFMTEQMMFNNEEFWMMIATEYQHLNIDFNSQNKSGTTALMLAAENPADENLIYILNIVDNLDLFVSDCKGVTFPHVYMASVKLQEDLEFLPLFFKEYKELS